MRFLRVTALGICATALLATAPNLARAAEPRRAFDLKAAPLGQALLAFNLVTGAQVIVSRDLLVGRVSRPVRGQYTASQALARMLAGSGLHAERTGRGVLMILPDRPPGAPGLSPSPPAAQAAAEMAGVTVTAPRILPPVALTTLSGARLEQLGVVGLDQVGRLTPGLNVVNLSPAAAAFSMRGITQASGDASREPRMAVLQDGMPASKERGAYFELFDLDHIDIAKGPQPTLYGRGAMAGALDVIQHKADPQASAWNLHGEVGDQGQGLLEAMINQPIGQDLAVRVAARLRGRAGLTPNLAGGDGLDSVATDAARVSLTWLAGVDERLDLIVNYQRDRPTGRPLKSFTFAPTDPVTGAALGDLDRYTPPALGAVDETGRPAALGLDRTLGSVAVLAARRLSPGLKLSASLGYRRFYADERQDADGLSLPVISVFEQTRGVQYNADLRLAYDAGERWRGFAGVSLFHESGTQLAYFTIDERLLLARLVDDLSAPVPQGLDTLTRPDLVANTLRQLAARRGFDLPGNVALGLAGNLKGAYVERNQNFARTTAVDLFGDVTFAPGPGWALSAGLRYSHNDKGSAVATALPAGPSILAGAAQAFGLYPAQRASLLAALSAIGAGASAAAPRQWPNYALVFQPTFGNGEKFANTFSDDGWSGRLVARYTPSSTFSAYGSYARGRRPSVLVAGPPLAAEGSARFGVVPAETIDSLEIGARGGGFDQRLTLDLAAYAYRYLNFQTTKLIDGQLQTLNAGRADATGLEVETRFELSRSARLFAAYGYNHSRLRSGAFAGNQFRLAPDHKASLNLELTYAAPSGTITVLPAWSWQSKVFFSDDNDRPELSRGLVRDLVQDEVQGGYDLLDLRVNYQPRAANWSAGAFVTNLLDRRYLREAGFIGESFGFTASAQGTSRLWGLSLRIVSGARQDLAR